MKPVELLHVWLRDERRVGRLARVDRRNLFEFDAGFLGDDGVWGLAPAYDLTLSTGPGGEHWMTVVGEGRAPGPSHLLELGRRAGVVGAARILDEVTTALREWRTLAAGLDLSAASLRAVAAVLPR